MAIKNSGGHGVTTILGGHAGIAAVKANIQTPPTKGPADYQGTAPKGGGFKISGGGKKKISPSAPNKSVSKLTTL